MKAARFEHPFATDALYAHFPLIIAALLLLLPCASVQAQETSYSATLDSVAGGLAHPVFLTEPPDGTGRLFIVDQTGQIWILMPDGTLLDEPFLDISDRMVALNASYDERGLLGLAFHPDYAENGRFFVYYSAPLRDAAPDDFDNTSHIAEFAVSDGDPNRADPDSETLLLQVDEPQLNHAAGTLAFGPDDGYLYISLGDGGGANDVGTGHVADWYEGNEGGNGQDLAQNLLGSILRIDVDNPSGELNYGIPADNPFVGTDTLAEQYAYGFRNPYRFSFDLGGDHVLIVGDSGQDQWEEVSVVTKGGNYGWNIKEGTHCFDAANPETSPATCPDADASGTPLIDPVIEFRNANQEDGLGLVVVGGYVYRGSTLPDLDGKYVFGTWSRGEIETGGGGEESEVHLPGAILVADPAAEEGGLWPFSELRVTNMPGDSLQHFLLGFGQDFSGEVYALTADSVGPTGTTGKVFRLMPSEPVAREDEAELPARAALEQNYPNPFNPETTIRFHLAAPTHVRLTVYDMIGREVVRLFDGPQMPGDHALRWDGRDEAGRLVPSGAYLYRLEAGRFTESNVMTLLK